VPLWLVLIFMVMLVAFTLISGWYLVWPARGDSAARADLGNALVSGFIVAIAVLGLQSMVDWRLREIEDDRRLAEAERSEQLRLQAERQDLLLQLTSTKDLTGIDLRGADIRGFYLRKKIFSDALLGEAQLAGANLTEARLTGTVLERANLRGAYLSRADLTGAYLTEADLRCADLREAKVVATDFSGALLHGARLDGAIGLQPAALGGVRCDSATTFPQGTKVRCSGKPYDCAA
jgi:uncharacterized protein YjbI with pentapeptide repeats